MQSLGLGFGLSCFSYPRISQVKPGMEKRPLGRTGLDVTILGLGCATIGHGGHSIREGARIVEA